VASPPAILSRLLVLLALVLFGVPQSPADGTPAPAGPVAQSQAEQAQGNLAVQRHFLRAQLHEDDSPDTVAPGAANQTRQHLFAAALSPAPHWSRLPVAIRILPPVRGPPAA
jgi:hypothetical protein